MTGETSGRNWWLAASVVSTLAALSSLAVIVLDDGGVVEVVWIAFFAGLALFSVARYRGWNGAAR